MEHACCPPSTNKMLMSHRHCLKKIFSRREKKTGKIIRTSRRIMHHFLSVDYSC